MSRQNVHIAQELLALDVTVLGLMGGYSDNSANRNNWVLGLDDLGNGETDDGTLSVSSGKVVADDC